MISRRLVNHTSGTSANGIPNESTTWLSTSVRDGLSPIAATRRAGSIVSSRRTKIGIRRWMKPCITTWPESVPTVALESPDASSASAKSVPEAPPRTGTSVLWAVTSEVTSCRPERKKVLAAITSIERLIRPAIVIAMTTSIFV